MTRQRAWGMGKLTDAELLKVLQGTLVSLGILPTGERSIPEPLRSTKKSITPNYSVR
ncbi:unnamed protein product, partial [marine sediment metagenome]